MPGVMRAARSYRIAPRCACARTLAVEVNRKVASVVPTARCMRCARGRFCAPNSATSIGTMIEPPPMPSIPVKNPATAPVTTYPSHHPHSISGDPRKVVAHARALRRAHVQAAFRPPPQHVVVLARPLVRDQVVDLALEQPAAEILAEVRARARVADDRVGERPV